MTNKDNKNEALKIAELLLKQVEDESNQSALWVISALSKLAKTDPSMTLTEALSFINNSMPKTAEHYRNYSQKT